MTARRCNLMVHNPAGSSGGGDEVILNPEVFPDMKPGGLIQIYDPERPDNVLVLRVPALSSSPTGRLEISLLKTVADGVGFKQFSRVVVDHAREEDSSVDFVELSFRKLYLQRGSMFRIRTSLMGRTVYQNQPLTVPGMPGMQASVQDVRRASNTVSSGLITPATKFVFRSKSARIIWLVQISAEMWDVDQNGEMYFEKFLQDFVGPVFDSWKSLGVSHMLSIIFFARTLYLDDRITPLTHPDLFTKKSFVLNDGYYQQDHVKVVLENIADIDKHKHMNKLRSELWTFAKDCGWKIPDNTGHMRTISWPTPGLDPSDEGRGRASTDPFRQGNITCAVPSDAMHGNFLESINISLNILDKHYMDRDLARTGNSIVVISAGTGIFKVKPRLSLISKQRMVDNAFGIDLVSLSRPPVHAVPLFVVEGKKHQAKDFYEVPHWLRISFTDCRKDFVNARFLQNFSLPQLSDMLSHRWDSVWATQTLPHPLATYLSSQLGYYSFLVSQMKADTSIKAWESLTTLRNNYALLLPYPLRLFLQQQQHLITANSTDLPTLGSATVTAGGEGSADSTPHSHNAEGLLVGRDERSHSAASALAYGLQRAGAVPAWGLLDPEVGPIEVFKKSIVTQQDVVTLRRLSSSPSSALAMGGKMLPEIFESIPILKNQQEENAANSFEESGLLASRSLARSMDESAQMIERALAGSKPPTRPAWAPASRHGNTSTTSSATAGGAGAGMPRITSSEATNISSSVHSAGGGAGDVPVSKYASVLARRAQLRELSCLDNWDSSSLLEVMQAYDAAASVCFKRPSSSSAISLHEQTSSEDRRPRAVSKSDRLIEVDDDRKDGSKPPSRTTPIPRGAVPAATAAAQKGSAPSLAAGATSGAQVSAGQTPRSSVTRTPITAIARPTAPPAAPSTSAHSTHSAHSAHSAHTPHGAVPAEKSMLSVAVRDTPPPTPPRLATTPTPISSADTVTTSPAATAASSTPSASQTTAAAVSKAAHRDPAAARLLHASLTKGKTSGRSMGGAAAAARHAAVQQHQREQEQLLHAQQQQKEQQSTSQQPSPVSALSSKGPSPLVNPNRGSHSPAVASPSQQPQQQQPSPFPQPPQTSHTRREPSGALGRMVFRNGKMRRVADQPPVIKNEKEAEEFLEYEKKYGINPFRHKDGEQHLSLITHNRRRWAHVFPLGRKKVVDHDLNWKSLTQPAILPMFTDYLPPALDLKAQFTVEDAQYTWDSKTSHFSSLQAAVLGIVCYRLSHEFQLVENIDYYSKYVDFAKYMVSSPEDALVYVLTMGHRIHIIVANKKTGQIAMRRYVSRKGRNEEEKKESESDRTRVHYRYEIWSAQSENFQTISQSFAHYPDEFLWSQMDQLILGESPYDGNAGSKKPRSLKYVVIPPPITTEKEAQDYMAKIDLLLEFLSKGSSDGVEGLSVTRDCSVLPSSETNSSGPFLFTRSTGLWYRQTLRDTGVMKRMLRGPRHENPNWIYIKHDKHIYTFKAFHIHIEWFVCDSWEINDFVNNLFRRSGKWGLRLCQTPGYFATPDLNVHPFRPLPYIQVRATSAAVPAVYSSALRVIERFFFSWSGDWLFDSERNTDWVGIGLPFPNYSERDRDILADEAPFNGDKSPSREVSVSTPTPPTVATSTLTAAGSSLNLTKQENDRRLQTMFERDILPRLTYDLNAKAEDAPFAAGNSRVVQQWSPRLMSKRYDRQYVHRLCLATVRVGGQGFLWLPSAGAKMSDITTGTEDRPDQARKTFAQLEAFSAAVVDCYEIVLLDIVEAVFPLLEAAASARVAAAAFGEQREVSTESEKSTATPKGTSTPKGTTTPSPAPTTGEKTDM